MNKSFLLQFIKIWAYVIFLYMKKLLILSLFVFYSSIFLSCASNSSKVISGAEEETVAPVVKTALKKNEIMDWQYKGFGNELPVWVEALYKGGVSEVKKMYPEYDDKDLVVFQTYAGRLDHAESLFNVCIKKDTEEKPLDPIDRPELFDEDGMRIFTVGNEYRKEGLGKDFNLNGDIYQIKERCWVLLKEFFYDDDGNFQNEEISYRSIGILVREDTGL